MRIKIISNPKKQWAKELARELAAFLTQNTKHQAVKSSADATICIGGDGTILYASHKGRAEGVVLGIGSDKSYICQLHKDDWKAGIAAVLDGGQEHVMALECELNGKKYTVINDIVVHATHYRVAELALSIETGNRKKETQFEGDGIIVSSPLGSAAYAYSAGAERLAPKERKLIVVPICPYKRAFSPQTLSEDAAISITAGSDCAFIIDGIFVRRLKKGEVVRVRKGKDMLFFGGVGKSF